MIATASKRDLPGLASKASDYAINYGEMTPKVPHASHMLSHIYTLGWANGKSQSLGTSPLQILLGKCVCLVA